MGANKVVTLPALVGLLWLAGPPAGGQHQHPGHDDGLGS